MTAMMRAQMQMSSLMISQLAQIEDKLTTVETEVKQLDVKIRKLIAENYRDGLINGITSAAASYRELLATGETDPTVFQAPATLARLGVLAQLANTNRNTLIAVPEGYGPESALIVPVACALEISCSARVGFPDALIITILTSYEKWLKSMISDRPGSILRYEQEALERHESAIEAAKVTRLGKAFVIDAFSLSRVASREKHVIDDYCVLFSHVFAASDVLVSKQQYMPALGWAATVNAGATWYNQSAALTLEHVPSLNCDQLSYTRNHQNVGFAQNHALSGAAPESECYVRRSNAIFEADAATKYALGAEASGAFNRELEALVAVIDEINISRARIAFADKAKSMVNDTLARVKDQIDFVRG